MIGSFAISLIKHSDISDHDVTRIISLKSQHWKYDPESQIKWLNEHLQSDDCHLLLSLSDHSLVGYLNIVLVDCQYDHASERLAGIGNVCVDRRVLGEGVGLLLMAISKFYVRSMKLRSVLLCSSKLVGFYEKAGWREFLGSVTISGELYKKKIMFDRIPVTKTVSLARSF